MTDKRLKICCICNDKAIGKNFGAVTCESCKAFFRRTALKTKLKCPFDDQCQINTVTRKFCQKCRLAKCLAMGMKIESLVNDKHRESIRRSIEYKRKLSEGSDCQMDSSLRLSPDSTDYGFNREIYKCEKFEAITGIKKEFESYSTDFTSIEATGNELAVMAIDRPIDRHTFNEFEYIKLTEVLNVIPLITDPFVEHINIELTELEAMRVQTTIKFCRDIGNLVEFSKNLSAFREVCEEDQIAMIKFGCTEILSMRSITTFDVDQERFYLYMDRDTQFTVKLDMFKPLKRHVYPIYKNYLAKMSMEWENDPMIVNLLTVIMLFNPNLPEVTHKDVISLHQKTYMYLLQKYLLLKYGSEYVSREKFIKLLSAMKEVFILGNVFRLNGSEMDDLTPFLAEIFDAKNKTSAKIF